MQTEKIKDKYIGSEGKKALYDIHLPVNDNKKLILFIHGYMGFKDWGAWNLMQEYFVSNGFGFCKLNLTHNGIGLKDVDQFTDLDAFANNSYSKEVEDVKLFIDFITDTYHSFELILMGHSRGGAIALLNGNHSKVSKIITLASISSISKRFSDNEMITNWEKEGIRYVQNQRTKQMMPHNYSQYIDFLENKETLDIHKCCLKLKKEVFVFHGENDSSVPIEEGEELANYLNVTLHKVENADHVFGASHPWIQKDLPKELKRVADKIILILNS
ncbi:MAG: alpha/beta hydrolase [Flavobacteriia bacterium]|nr:alpha/beta hydrolase [Flavobacteriia bacterium]